MATGKGKKTSKPRRRMPVRRRRFVKPARSSPNTAKVVEFYPLGTFEANVAHEFSVNGIIPAVNGAPTRASMVAPAYGLYRIAQVEFKITPTADTYTPDLAPIGDAAVEVPKLYWKMNRYGDAPVGFGEADMLSLSSKPLRLDDKTLTIKYKPNILLANVGQPAQADAGGSGQVKITPWLSTDSKVDNGQFALSTTTHYGHLMFIECAAAGDGTPRVAEIQCRVVYEFKNPRMYEGVAVQERRQATPHIKHTVAGETIVNSPAGWTNTNGFRDASGNPL